MGEGIDPTSPRARRLRQNEELMEELNRRMERMLEEIREDDESTDADDPIAFLCECSHLDCRERVHLEPSLFDRIHKDPEQFVLVPGHEVPDIERVVDQLADFLIVRKLA